MIADSLIRERDAIVGPWQGSQVALPFRLENVKRLWDWEPWVRAAVFDLELITRIHFSRGANGVLTVWHLDVNHAANGRPAMNAGEIVSVICPRPSVFRQQLKFMDEYADLREDRATEILVQIGPQHAFWSAITNVHPERTKKTHELLDLATRFAVIVEMRFKHAMAVPRPLEFSPQLQPMILTPGHGSFPSGHSTQAHFIARILCELMARGPKKKLWREQLMKQAARVAINRTVAGVHYPVDSALGRLLGTTLAEYFIRRCKGGGGFLRRRFDGRQFNGRHDFDPTELLNSTHDHVRIRGTGTADRSAILNWLWSRAEAEWNGKARG